MHISKRIYLSRRGPEWKPAAKIIFTLQEAYPVKSQRNRILTREKKRLAESQVTFSHSEVFF